LGRLDAAVESYAQALQRKPVYPEVHCNLGVALHLQGRLDAASAHYRQAIASRPDFAEAHYNLANTLQALGQLDAAATHLRKALSIKPDLIQAHYNLGNLLKDQGKLDAAAASYRQVLAIDPGHAEVHNNLGSVLESQGQPLDAAAHYRSAIALKPNDLEAHNNLGNVLRMQGDQQAAVQQFQTAIAIDPQNAGAHSNLGNVLMDQGQINAAITHYRTALACNPEAAEAHSNLGSAWQTLGQLEEAVACLRQALRIKPHYSDAHSNLIFALDLMTSVPAAAQQEERQRWDIAHAAPLMRTHQPHANTAEPHRRLRIGYVSGDFRIHSAAAVFGAMLVHFDHSRFEVFAYSNTQKEDFYTQMFSQQVSCWRKIVGLSDAAAAALIRADQIDILVDLSGHSSDNRLLVFARKPAPIQITAWGYATSTGLKTMDVFFADPVVVPPEEKTLFTEEVRYLPNVVGYFNALPTPAINRLPALTSGHITFGSFNRLTKISESAFQVWAQVLSAIPDSRLVLKTGELGDAATRDRVAAYFTRAGINPQRIVMLGKTSWEEHMKAFGLIDIALDPFPHGGGVTTLEGLMMGIPVVTLHWNTIVGRLSASILTTLGMIDWIATSPQQYVEIAVQKARDLTALQSLRASLRGQLITSPIGNSAIYVAAVEQEYRTLWQRWCSRQNAHSTASVCT